MKEPKRETYPKGAAGEKAYQKARAEYIKWLQTETSRQTQMDLAPIKLPGLGRSPSDTEAKRWFKFVGARAKKGTQARKYYDDFTNALTRAGVPKKDWQSVWDDAVDWTQTYGNDSNGIIINYLNDWSPSDYKDEGEGKKYGKTKSKQTTVTEYSTSAAASDLTSAYKSELGFEPGAEAITAYQQAVNKMAKGEPAVYTSTTTTAPGKGGVLSTSTSTAKSQTGFDPTRFAIEYARSNPDYAENFAVRSFMKLIDQSLSDPNRIGQVVD